MFGYIICVSFCFIMKLMNRKELKNITLIFLTLFTGLRFNVGADYLSYGYIFNTIKSNQNIRIEPLYWLINKILPNYILVCSFVAFLSLYFIFKFINYLDEKNFYFILFGYVSIYYLQWNMSTVRQGLAISIFLYSTIFLFEKKYKKYLFFILVGGLFHKTLFLAFLIYPIFKLKIKDRFLIISFFCLFIFRKEIFSILEFLILKYRISYSSYILGFVKNQLLNSGIKKTFIIRVLIYLSIAYLSKKQILKTNYKVYVIKKIACFLMLSNLLLQSYGNVAIRAIKPYEIFIVLSFFYLIKYLTRITLKLKQISIMFITTIYFFYYVSIGSMYYPYETIFVKKNYENKVIKLHPIKYYKTRKIFKDEGYSEEQIDEFYRIRGVIK
ncbi:hypothetical protein RN96_11465 [Fusobacterium polymorphum]|uniref:EpsG family protein n=1 Tax=Fusobacterium nucleatum subsp. polymorphum TaxID=76857 RepID=A0A2B7YF80_FUSNP|nr:EpsG family protein [Fusobacterium polymorphum]PGH20186.1 hypothetical protein RN96_11465 [Fusobacterium polymorphum]